MWLGAGGIIAGLACAISFATASEVVAPVCSGFGVDIRAGFEQARVSQCVIESEGAATIVIEPETKPINASPWYAFEIQTQTPRQIRLKLTYSGYKHRYRPWLKEVDQSWRLIPESDVAVVDGDATITVPPSSTALQIAGAPIDRLEQVREQLVASGKLQRIEAGRSVDGAPLEAFLWRPVEARRLVVIAARQHPPERSGAMAFDAFAARVIAELEQDKAAFSDTAILFLPVINPDGIMQGHWRGNKAGTDLNRDWHAQVQPETRGIGAVISALSAETPLAAMIDFHSTFRNVIYAPPLAVAPDGIGERFISSFMSAGSEFGFTVDRSHKSEGGTLKAWSLDRFGVGGLTFELADRMLPHEAEAAGIRAASAFITALKGDKGL